MKFGTIMVYACLTAVGLLVSWPRSVGASIRADEKCLQGTYCPVIYGTCENAAFPNCNEACDVGCTGPVGLMCFYKPGDTCNSTGTFVCATGQRMTCKPNTGGVEQCDCYLPYIPGTFSCGSVYMCTVP